VLLAASLLLAFAPPPNPPLQLEGEAPVEPAPTVVQRPAGGSVPPGQPPSPSAPAAPARPPQRIEAVEPKSEDEQKKKKKKPSDSRRARRNRFAGSTRLLGTERANMFQATVPDGWDATTIINTDRPDFTDALPTVGHRVTYVEAGYHWEKANGPLRETAVLHLAPEVLVRYGFHDRVELRVKTTAGLVQDHVANELRLVGQHYIGFKAEVFRQRGWIPAHTLVPVINVTNGVPADGGHLIIPELGWVYGWQVRKWIAFRGSTGIDGTPNAMAFGNVGFLEIWQSLSVYWHLQKNLGIHSEWGLFAYPLLASKSARVEGFHTYGIYFYPTPELLIDVRVGDAIEPRDSSWYIGAGISLRIKPRRDRLE
jgi:hypothetical protein